MRPITDLLGKTLESVENRDNDEIVFRVSGGQTYRLYHDQDCCENVTVEDIVGELADLVGSPITMAEEASNSDDPPVVGEYGPPDSHTWTFYKLATVKGYVTIRWYGTSNGYYSEGVSFEEVTR